MLAVVMEGGSHTKRAWDDEHRRRRQESRSVMHRMTESTGARSGTPELHNAPSFNPMLPPIVTAAEQPSRQIQADRVPASSIFQGAPQRPPQAPYAQDVSSKRPRQYYDNSYQSDPGRGQPSVHGAPAAITPTGHDSRDQHQWPVRDSPNLESMLPTRDSCQNCFDSKGLVEKVVSGLERLEAELRQVLASSPLSRTATQESREPPSGFVVSESGLRNSLVWASSSVETSTRLLREFAATQRALPRISVANLGMPPVHEQPGDITSAPPDFARSFMEKSDRDRSKDTSRRHGPPYQSEYQLRRPDSQSPPSPHPTVSSGMAYGGTPSPMGIGASGRMLPSPASLQTAPTLASVQGNYSPKSSHAAHTTHLQDLQHQISTKSLALTTLQREHDQLLAAYSRMQIRCQTLDKKSQVSDHEINTLTEEKIRLQSQVEAFEVQVEELVKARDEAQKQTTANGAQYMQIMAMSSKLQFQGAEEAKRYKMDREAWERDREVLQRRIEDLEAGRSDPAKPGDSIAEVRAPLDPDDILTSASLDALRREVVRLRQSLLNMEQMFQGLRQETESIGNVITECTGIRERLTAMTVSGPQPEPMSTRTRPAEIDDTEASPTMVAEATEAGQGTPTER